MKRSEMIQAIETAILSSVGVDPDTGAVSFPNPPGYMGGKVLDTIEQAGMIPPALTNTPFPVLTVTADQWEPEDETQ